MKKLIVILLSVLCLLSLCACAPKSAAEGKTVKLGLVGEGSEQWQPVVDALKKEGVTLELVTFADYQMPNQALEDGEIDLNSFQHYAFFNNQVADKGYDLSAIGETIIAPLGLYSQKVTDVAEIGAGAKLVIPNDATNGGRALKLLEAAGLLTIDPAAGYTPTVKDITDNPLELEIVEVEAANTPSLLPDADAAVINGGHAVDNGLLPSEDAIFLESVEEGADNPYINIIAARTEDKDDVLLNHIVALYQSDEVKQIIEEQYKGSYLTVW